MAKKKTTLSPELQAMYKREVARVNKQLYRLEKALAGKPERLAESAYGTLMKEIKKEFGEQRRFGKGIPANVNIYHKRMNMIRRFYEKPSATLSGWRGVHQKRAETYTKKLGMNLTADDLKDFFESGLWKELLDRFGSAKAIKYWKTVEKQKDRIVQQLNEGKKVTFRGRLAKDINEMGVDDLLREYLESEK